MSKKILIKNITFAEPQVLANLTDYQEGRVISRTLAQNQGVSITLFAFDVGEGLSTHTAPGDAMVYILDGEAFITIDGKEMTAKTGEVVIMPANTPHALKARKPFKMLLTVVKKPRA